MFSNFIVLKRAVLSMILFIWGNTALASVWFMNKSAPNKTAEVDVTAIMWGVPDTISHNTEDRIVFQVASSEYREVKLILESDPVRGEKLTLSIPTGVHIYKSTREYTSWSYSRGQSREQTRVRELSYCTLCHKEKYYFPRGKEGGTCYSEIFIPRTPGLNKLSLIDVQAEGASVCYSIKTRSKTDVTRDASRISLPLNVIFHTGSYKEVVQNDVSTTMKQTDSPTSLIVDLTLVSELVFEHPTGRDFKEHVQKLANQYKGALHNFGNSYLAALETLRKRTQNKADLKVLLAVESEIERFNSTRQVTNTILSDKDTILHLQISYQKGAERMSTQLWESLQALSDSYIDKLKPIQDDLIKEGKTEKALRIQKEIARIRATPETLVKSESPAREIYNASRDSWDNR